jgi:hypothetical protein
MPASGRNRGRRLGSQFSGLAGVEAGAPAADLPPFPDFVRRGAGAVERGRSRNALLGVPACPASVEARRHNSDHSPSRGPTPAPDRAHDTCRTRRLGRRGARSYPHPQKLYERHTATGAASPRAMLTGYYKRSRVGANDTTTLYVSIPELDKPAPVTTHNYASKITSISNTHKILLPNTRSLL